jgi:hypothetical protein
VPLGDSYLQSLKETSPQKPADDTLDVEFGKLEKEQRIWRATLDNWYERVSHPFVLVIVFFFASMVFATTRYWDNDVAQRINKDTGTVLSYLATVVVTSVFTKFLERRKS